MWEDKTRSEIRHEAMFAPGAVRLSRAAKQSLSLLPIEIGLENTVPNHVGQVVPVVLAQDSIADEGCAPSEELGR